jgi:hypothetical protein
MGVYGVGAVYNGEDRAAARTRALVRMIDSNVSSGRVVTGGSSLARGRLASAGAAASMPTAGRDSDGSCCSICLLTTFHDIS